MYQILRQVVLVIAVCIPLILLVYTLLQRYSPSTNVLDIGILEAILLVAAIGLPVFVLPRLGVDWRPEPEDYQGKTGK